MDAKTKRLVEAARSVIWSARPIGNSVSEFEKSYSGEFSVMGHKLERLLQAYKGLEE